MFRWSAYRRLTHGGCLLAGLDPEVENAWVPTANSPDQGQPPSLGRELRGWAIALVLAVPVVVAEWLFLRALPEPWNVLLLSLPWLVGLIVIGVHSKSNIWALLVWLGPFVVLDLVWLAGFRNGLAAAGLVLALVWIGGIMLSERFGKAAYGWVGGAHAWLTALGLPPAKRKAYGELRRALRVSAQERRDRQQLDDLPRTVRAIRNVASRVEILVPPDDRWAEVYAALAAPSAVYADMLEGKRALDYDEANAVSGRGRQLLDELLRDESPTYRFLTYVPLG